MTERMSLPALVAALNGRPEFIPYVHGATRGDPSPTLATGVPAEAVRAAQRRVREALAREQEALADPDAALDEAMRQRFPESPARCGDCGYLVTAPGHLFTCEAS